MSTSCRFVAVAIAAAGLSIATGATSVPVRAQKGMVASQSEIAARIGADVIRDRGTAVDAAVATAFALARDGFTVSDGLSRSLKRVLPQMQKFPASVAQFSKNGVAYEPGETLKQPDLAHTLERIASQGPAGFYEGETALALEKEMLAHGGLITRQDLKNYRAIRRAPVKGTYRGYEILAMPPISSGGVGLIEMLNVLEGYDLARLGPQSAAAVQLMAEAMKRAYSDRARFLGDPDFV